MASLRLASSPALSLPRKHGSQQPLRQRPTQLQIRASAQKPDADCSPSDGSSDVVAPTRRRELLSLAAGISLATVPSFLPQLQGTPLQYLPLASGPALAGKDVSVGSFLPAAGVENFVVFKPGPKDTPALRAGNVSPYSFFLPPSWVQQRIANILSGNYCQPKCAEPWIEVKFEDPKQGTLQIVASPMVRLTNKPEATIEEIGVPEKIIAALGPFVTGDSYDPDELVSSSVKSVDGQTYYEYTLETPFARSGSHNLAAATAKGSTVLLMVISANDSQWNNSEPVLRKLIDSFRVL